MLPITYTMFPAMLWTSFDFETAPESLPIGAYDPKAVRAMQQSKDFHQLFALLGVDYFEGKSLAQKMRKVKTPNDYQPHTHLYLSKEVFDKVDNDARFRAKHWANILKLPTGSGTVLFGDGGTYLFRILSVEDSKVLSDSGLLSEKIPFGTRWFCVGYFAKDDVIGFEYGFLSYSKGLAVQEGGLYMSGAERGQFFSFVGIALSYFHFGNVSGNAMPQILWPESEQNKTSQKIVLL